MIEGLKGKRIYLDANVFVYALEGFPKYSALTTSILRTMEQQGFHATTSEITVAESLVHPFRLARLDLVATYRALLQDRPALELVPVTRDILEKSAELRATIGGRLPDAVHAATALKNGCSCFLTADARFKMPAPINLVTLDALLSSPL